MHHPAVLIKFRSLLLMAAIALLCIGARAGGDVWTEVRTDNFHLIGNASEADIRNAGGGLEKFRAALRQVFPDLRSESRTETNVIVFKDQAAYTPFKPVTADGLPDESAVGYFLAAGDVNYITFAAAGRTDPFNTVFHEYTHYVLNSNFGPGKVPAWLGEGLAEYFETFRVEDGAAVFGREPAGHASVLRKEKLIPLGELFAVSNKELHRERSASRGLFYAQSWAAVHFLMQRGGAGKMAEFLKAAPAGIDTALARVYSLDAAAFERELSIYVANFASVPPSAPRPSGSAAKSVQAASKRITEATAKAYLGDLLSRMGRVFEGEEMLREALKLEPSSPEANAALGDALVRQERFAEAKPFLQKAVAKSNTAAANFNYAYAVSRESADAFGRVAKYSTADSAAMRQALRRAIAADNRQADPYALLAFINIANGENPDEAAEQIRTALSIDPGKPAYEVLLAKALVMQEKYSEAKAIAERVAASDAASRETRADAQAIVLAVIQYAAAREAMHGDMIYFGPPPIFLKRSAVTDADLARLELDRVNTNLNRILERPGTGERQAVGYVDRVTCRDGKIRYAVTIAGQKTELASRDFSGLRMSVLTEGSNSFAIDCGVGFGTQLTVLTYKPARPGIPAELVAIAFVPESFRLKTPEELANARTVIIE